jgi:FkbM family methyltransferase
MSAPAAEAAAEPEELVGPEGFILHADRNILTASDIAALTNGSWETGERQMARTQFAAGERVIECGACIGVVSMTLARVVGPGNLLVVEANPAAADLARRNFARNGFSIPVLHGMLRNRAHLAKDPGPGRFHVAPAVVSSGIVPMRRGTEITVPVMELETLIASNEATVLVADIEGGEVDLLCGADLSRLQKIILETHYRKVGRAAVNRMVRELYAQGFCIDLASSRNEVIFLHRGLGPEA